MLKSLGITILILLGIAAMFGLVFGIIQFLGWTAYFISLGLFSFAIILYGVHKYRSGN